MIATVHRFPEQDRSGRADVLAALRRARRDLAAGAEGAQSGEPDLDRLRGLSQELNRQAEALDEALSAFASRASGVVVRSCAAALSAWADQSPGESSRFDDVRGAVDRALAAVAAVLEDPDVFPLTFQNRTLSAGSDPSIASLFPVYRSLRHLAAAQRVHPAELWSGVAGVDEICVDVGAPPRACDASAVADLEAALLRSLRKPDAHAFGRLSDLCAALGAGDSAAAPMPWGLASAVFEAQKEGLLEPDIYLKRLGSQLLALARAKAAPAEALSAAPMAIDARRAALLHELWFFVAHAAPPWSSDRAPRLAPLRERLAVAAADVAAHRRPVQPQPAADVMAESAADLAILTPHASPSATPVLPGPRSLLEAVPGLPSWQDLDLDTSITGNTTGLADAAPDIGPHAGWPAEVAGATGRTDEAVKVIGTLRIEIERFHRFLVEADELSRQLGAALGEWSVAAREPVHGEVVGMAQALAVESAAVGHTELSGLCAMLARALARSAARGRFEAGDATLFLSAQEEASRLLHQFAAGFLKPADDGCLAALRAYAGDDPPRAPLPQSLSPLARQAEAARRRMTAALARLREEAAQAPGEPLALEALDAVDREAQTLSALFEDLCERWPGASSDPDRRAPVPGD